MFTVVRREIEWGGRPFVLETGKVARQADGAVIASYGNTVVLCTVVGAKTAKDGIDFLPLTVHYQEKAFAAGKIPGGFFKREGRPSEKEVLTSRLIDRPLRPLFPSGFHNDVQVICTVLSHDLVNDPDMVALVGSAAALAISGIPFNGPLAGCRVAYSNEQYILNPEPEQLAESKLDLVVAGTSDSVLMVESAADQLSEAEMLGAVIFGHEQIQPVISLITEFAEAAGKPQWAVPVEQTANLEQRIAALAEEGLRQAYREQSKQLRGDKVGAIKTQVLATLVEEGNSPITVNHLLKDLEKAIVRRDIVDSGIRIDGRDNKTVRPIVSEVGVLPRTHGSALFTRGETQALVVTTLGTSQDEQIIDALGGDSRESFMLHYNFPPYSVGESTPLRAPGRREVGHGKLAWRALHALLPSKADFPYTIRVVSEITESNGSSSMATVCGASLAMMDAGVPLKSPVAGIAMGLIKENDKFAVISDILGDEDHLGDMDFKVAGTDSGVTALQMDIKIKGITIEIMRIALDQAKEGRIHILQEMARALSESREGVNENAPTITTYNISKDKIREVIGSGGKVIREICEVSGAKIDIEDDGTIRISAINSSASEKALQMIKDIVLEPEVGTIYSGKVVKIVDFGAFVNFLGSRDGLVHISELAEGRVATVQDVVSEGDEVKVKVLGMDNRGKIKLSLRDVDQVTGADISANKEARPAPSGDDKPREKKERATSDEGKEQKRKYYT
jgi:polyribonucleotide nucleotidyltransferase